MLRVGDRVAVIAPCGPVDVSLLDVGVERLRSWGLEVVEGHHARNIVQRVERPGEHEAPDDAMWSASDAERLADLEWALLIPQSLRFSRLAAATDLLESSSKFVGRSSRRPTIDR